MASRNKKKDGNHDEFVDYFRGNTDLIVTNTFQAGDGLPDILLSGPARDTRQTRSGGVLQVGPGLLVEIKNTNHSGAQLIGDLTKAEKIFLENWCGPYAIVSSVDQAVEAWADYIEWLNSLKG